MNNKFAHILIIIVVAMFGIFSVWAAHTEIDEISRGDGRVIPASRTQSIQATEPGVIKDILVKPGQVVKQGQLIVRLDDTTSASELGEFEARVRALKARIARIQLEEIGDLTSPYACPVDVKEAAVQICENEQKLMEARRAAHRNTRSVLKQRLLQRKQELGETTANIKKLTADEEISGRELKLIEGIAKRKLVAQTELIRVQKEYNRVIGELSISRETVPRLEGAIEEAELQMKELELQFKQDALTQKTEALSELSVLQESVRGETNKVDRTDISSPVDGVINTMEVNTIGSFVQPGTVVAEVVPTSQELFVEARISPNDVAFVVPGQQALVKITAFDFSIFGGLEGEVVNVSPDSIVDQNTGEPYFEVRIKTARSSLSKGSIEYNITPGMICVVDIITGRKTILSYLLKPINKARQEAFTER